MFERLLANFPKHNLRINVVIVLPSNSMLSGSRRDVHKLFWRLFLLKSNPLYYLLHFDIYLNFLVYFYINNLLTKLKVNTFKQPNYSKRMFQRF